MPQVLIELEHLSDQTLVGLLAGGVRDHGLQATLLSRGVYLIVYYRTNGIDIDSTLALRGKRQHATVFGPNEQRVMPLAVAFGNPTIDDFNAIMPGTESDIAIDKLSPDQVDRAIAALLERLQEPMKTNNIFTRRLRTVRKHNERLRGGDDNNQRRSWRTAAIRAVEVLTRQQVDFFELLLSTTHGKQI